MEGEGGYMASAEGPWHTALFYFSAIGYVFISKNISLKGVLHADDLLLLIWNFAECVIARLNTLTFLPVVLW
jgi:hypothetical protein